jgi:GNAT superfamily N-acetyltransferase
LSEVQDSHHTVAPVAPGDLDDLLPLMRAYCDFYRAGPSDEALLSLSRTLLADPLHEGVQLIARDERGRALGFATIYWSWSTTTASQIAVMNDLYVDPAARGGGVADALIAACATCSRERGATALEWQTAPDNLRAQAVYDRVGASRENWINYTLALRSPDARA